MKITKDKRTKTLLSNLCIFRGIYYLNKNDYNRSIMKFKQAVVIYPKSFVAHANLGYIYFTLGNYEKALVEYKKAYEIDPKNQLIYNNIVTIISCVVVSQDYI